ncbi:heterokaryon incompatibility protein-domain-containing protein, partial [Echria macrotheca]
MHLLNVRTRRIEEFYGKTIPKYAILSHTWGRHEISFQAMQSYGARYKRWPRKLSGLCMQAAADGIDYVWIDTCCINKKDLVELSESINSMFTWYQKATVCYVYLADVQLESGGKTGTNWRAFRRSRWFTRGWTLQELLAPDQMKFYDSEWTFFGTKRELSAKLQAITNIPRSFILGATPVSEASVAQRFSWVASRETTRVEDMAYCLLGLFNVNMPMIYGEGEKAFVRLQHEIMKVHRDQSILAWGFDVDDEGNLRTNLQQNQTEVLATRPQQFRHCGRLVKSQNFRSQNTFEWLTGTLKLQLTLYTDPDDGEAYGLLNCGHEATLDKVVGLALVKLPAEGSDCYTRKPG